jgi:hypothetical protein
MLDLSRSTVANADFQWQCPSCGASVFNGTLHGCYNTAQGFPLPCPALVSEDQAGGGFYATSELTSAGWTQQNPIVPIGNPTLLQVTPATATIVHTAQKLYQASLRLSTGVNQSFSMANITGNPGVTFSSSDPTKATINPITGLAQGIAVGTCTISASYAGPQGLIQSGPIWSATLTLT